MEKSNLAKKVFGMLLAAEIITIIVVIFESLAAGILGAGALAQSGIAVAIGAVAAVVFGIVAIVGAIISFVAIIKGRTLNHHMMSALVITIISIILSVCSTFFPTYFGTGLLARLVTNFTNITNLLVAICVIYAIRDLANEADNADLLAYANRACKIYTVIAVIDICSNILSALITSTGFLGNCISFACIVLFVIAYFIYLKLLGKASKEL